MDKKATAIGIDVGKHKLDVALIIEGKVGSKSVANSSAGYQELTAWMTWQNVELDSCLVSTVNRDIAAIRAALNFSLAKGHVTTDVAWKAPPPPNIVANWLAAILQVCCGIFQSFSILRKARYSNSVAASSLGKWPRFFLLRCEDSHYEAPVVADNAATPEPKILDHVTLAINPCRL